MSETDLVLIVVASLVGSFVKSVTGMGYPLIAIPFLTLFIGVETAVAVVAIPNTLANLVLNLGVRQARAETRDLPVIVTMSAIGAVAGTLVLVEAPEDPLVIGLAVSVFAFVVQYVRNPHLRLEPSTTHRWAPIAGAATGFSQGAVGVGGQIAAMWFHGYRLSKDAYVFSVTALFFAAGLSQLIVLIIDGQIDGDRLEAAALATVATLAMIPLGTRLRGRLAGVTFERLIVALLVVSGVSLLLRVAT